MAGILDPRRPRLVELVYLLKDKVVGSLRETCFIRVFGTKLGIVVIILGSAFRVIGVLGGVDGIFLLQRRDVVILITLDTPADVHVDCLGGLLSCVEAVIA